MKAEDFVGQLSENEINFFAGVPDSLLNALSMELANTEKAQLMIEVNEGACLALAAGHHMATGKTPAVFLQNSGLGNIVNPYTSLAHDKVYGVPVLFIVGWRGEPGTKDEPQHKFMGEITVKMLEVLEIAHKEIDEATTPEQIAEIMKQFDANFKNKQSCAFVVKKNTFTSDKKIDVRNDYDIVREKAIEKIISLSDKNDIFVSTTGKISRELFETRERLGQPHSNDFLTVGSMGYASSVAAQIATEKPDSRVICLDGDGAALMHMGCMATIGNKKLKNLVHIILDNELHESVGGVPTVSGKVDWVALAKAVGYKNGQIIKSQNELNEMKALTASELTVIKTNKLSRSDLGRPTTTAKQNITEFMKTIQKD